MSSSLVPDFSHEYSSSFTAVQPYRFISSNNISVLIGLLDFLLIVTSSVLSAIVYHYIAFEGATDVKQYLGLGCVSALIFLSLSASRKLYEIHSLSYFPRSNKKYPFAVVSRCSRLRFNLISI